MFLYGSPEAQHCVADEWYESAHEAMDVWGNRIEADSWTVIDDPLPDCQEDCILPIRIKGRVTGRPEWGWFELLVNGSWVEYRK